MRTWLENTKYCSRDCMNTFWTGKPGRKLGKTGQKAWNKGKKTGLILWNKGNGEYAKVLGFGKWMSGKTASVEARIKVSEAMKKRVAEGTHNFYIDGRTPKNQKIRHSLNYKLWRESVFKRDDYTCQHCKARGVYLEADHVKPFAYFPELRFELSNGRALCRDCHAKTDTYKGRALNYA